MQGKKRLSARHQRSTLGTALVVNAKVKSVTKTGNSKVFGENGVFDPNPPRTWVEVKLFLGVHASTFKLNLQSLAT
jgi:hypothetical protein